MQTCWLLEVTQKLLRLDWVKEVDCVVRTRPLSVLLGKVAVLEVEEGS